MKVKKANPTFTSIDPGPFVIQVKDKELPGVYHHRYQAWTMEDAIDLASLLLDREPDLEVFIEVTYRVK